MDLQNIQQIPLAFSWLNSITIKAFVTFLSNNFFVVYL